MGGGAYACGLSPAWFLGGCWFWAGRPFGTTIELVDVLEVPGRSLKGCETLVGLPPHEYPDVGEDPDGG